MSITATSSCVPEPSSLVHYELICPTCRLINTWFGPTIKSNYAAELEDHTVKCRRCKEDLTQLVDGLYNSREKYWTCWACEHLNDLDSKRCGCGYRKDSACLLDWGMWLVEKESFRKCGIEGEKK